jgi:AAA domain (dynein-related subfamily)
MSNASNLTEIDQEQASNLAKLFIRSNQNIFLFGRRGVGKTHIALQAAKECNYKVNYINLSVIERPDLAGYPDINAEGDVVTFKSPQFLPRLIGEAKPDSILLFDEVDKAPPEVTAPLLEILQFRKINGHKINAAACVLTGNLISENAYSNQISSALLDRGAKYILTFNFEKWADWAKNNDVHDLILGFLRSNIDLACGKIEDTNYASPSPRGWTQASESIIKAKDFKIFDIETVTQIISGYVGYEVGLKFKMWYEYYRQYEPHVHTLIEKGMMSLDYHQLAPTEKVVFVIAASYHAKSKFLEENPKSKKRFVCIENLCKFFENYQVDKELQALGILNSFSFDFIGKTGLYECIPFFKIFKEFNDITQIKK